jgi:hypothetical protein
MSSAARYVRGQNGGMGLGCFEQFPDYLTQGESLRNSKRIFATLERDCNGEIPVPLVIAELPVE